MPPLNRVQSRERAEQGYEAIFNQAGEGICEADMDGRIVRANDRFCEIAGRTREKLVGKTVADLTYPGDPLVIGPNLERLAEDGGRQFVEKRLLRDDGTVVWVTVSVAVLRETDGRPTGAMAIVHDLTQRRKALAALRESEERHRVMGEASPIGLFTSDLQGRCLWANPKLAEIFGVAREQVQGAHWFELVHPEDRAGVSAQIEASRRQGRENILEYRLVRPDGTVRWARAQAAPMHGGDGALAGYAGSVEDITERRLAELERAALTRQIEEERRRLSNIMDALPALVWESRGASVEDLHVTFMSPYAETLLGISIQEYLATPGLGGTLVHAEDREAALTAVREALETGQPARYEFRATARGGRLVWLEARCQPILDRFGRAIGTRGVAVDITARKQAEDTMRRAEAAQREFVANVSHDFRTPLASIKGYAETLLRGADAKSTTTRLRFTKTILKNANRLEELVEDILTVSAVEAGTSRAEPVPLALSPFVAGVAEECAPVLRQKGLTLKQAVPRGLKIRFDRKHLGQILDNLVSNAARYNKRGGWIAVSARRPPGASKWVEVCVSDNGVGIAAEHLPRVFERFYRVDRERSPASKASGLGLHIVKRLVEAGGGRVWVESAAGRGSKFFFTAPAGE